MTEQQLEKIKKQIPVWKKLIDEDCTITILADDVVQYVSHAKDFQMTNEIGSRPPEGDGVWEAFEKKKEAYYEIPKEVYGVNIHGKYTPYFDDDGNFLCIIATAFSMEKELALESCAESINDSLANTAKTVSDYTESVDKLFSAVETVTGVINDVEQGTKEISRLVKEIKGNASRSKILALNATIEAARSGDAGRGFDIVAKEMGSLAEASNISSESIDEAISDMFGKLKSVSEDINSINETVVVQNDAIKGIADSVEVITQESRSMYEMTSNKKE